MREYVEGFIQLDVRQSKDKDYQARGYDGCIWSPHIPGPLTEVLASLMYPFSPQVLPQEFLMVQ